LENSYSKLDPNLLQELLQPICGKPLSATFRAIGQAFEFGDRRPATDWRGKTILAGDYILKFIYADWRIIQDDRIILASSDYLDERKGEFFCDSEQAPHVESQAEAWHRARNFLKAVVEQRFLAESVQVARHADVTVRLSENLLIESFSSSAQDLDLWFYADRLTQVSCLVGAGGQNVGNSDPPWNRE
jgi:hypothetical protein